MRGSNLTGFSSSSWSLFRSSLTVSSTENEEESSDKKSTIVVGLARRFNRLDLTLLALVSPCFLPDCRVKVLVDD